MGKAEGRWAPGTDGRREGKRHDGEELGRGGRGKRGEEEMGCRTSNIDSFIINHPFSV
jgi:hypothetical protein